jgi:hypothetical protein
MQDAESHEGHGRNTGFMWHGLKYFVERPLFFVSAYLFCKYKFDLKEIGIAFGISYLGWKLTYWRMRKFFKENGFPGWFGKEWPKPTNWFFKWLVRY